MILCCKEQLSIYIGIAVRQNNFHICFAGFSFILTVSCSQQSVHVNFYEVLWASIHANQLCHAHDCQSYVNYHSYNIHMQVWRKSAFLTLWWIQWKCFAWFGLCKHSHTTLLNEAQHLRLNKHYYNYSLIMALTDESIKFSNNSPQWISLWTSWSVLGSTLWYVVFYTMPQTALTSL